ncbi:MAG: ComEC/Rec2 family competence protein [Solirubrobacterales bacterium]|nr:ComEC/Rec2 family competence protein [Solirubrobacterales bacterium]
MTSCRGFLRDHPRHVLAGAVASGLALSRLDPVSLFVLAALLLILLTACESRPHVVVAASGLLLLGAGVGANRLNAIDTDPLAAVKSGPIELRGDIVQRPRESRTGTTIRLRARAPDNTRQTIEVRSYKPAPSGLRIGDEMLVRGSLLEVSVRGARTPEAASYARFLLRNGVRRRMQAKSIVSTGYSRTGPVGMIDEIRNRADRALALGLSPEPAALLRGMVLGGDAGLPEATAENFRVAGLSHILAVSGQNVLLIVILVQAILMALDAPRWSRIAIPAVVVLIYVLLCGAQASVVRAGAMGLAGLAAIAASRRSSRIYALLLAAIVVLFWNPRATADVGAQLSFAAVLGLMAFTRPLTERLHRLPRWAAEALAATASATLATAPLMAFHFGAVSIISLAANVLGAPLIGPIVWLGSLTAAIAQFSVPIGALLNAPNSFLLGALIEIARVSASVPGAQASTEGFGVPGLIVGAVIVVALAAFVHGWIPISGVRVSQLFACAGLLFALATFARGSPPPIGRPAIVMLDVGQGDATVLLGSDGCNALIDGGPPGAELAKKLEEIGIRQLDAAVVTHAATDHFGGILELAQSGEVPIKTLLDGGGNAPRPEYTELRRRLAARGTAIEPAVAGISWRCADISIKVIGPAVQPPGDAPPVDPNVGAAVTVVDVGELRMFGSGDAESPYVLPLALPPADILKVPHHGSADPGLPALLERLRPRVALVGVGASNRYGHPAPAVLEALRQQRAAVFRTDRDGAILVRADGAGNPSVSTAGPAR